MLLEQPHIGAHKTIARKAKRRVSNIVVSETGLGGNAGSKTKPIVSPHHRVVSVRNLTFTPPAILPHSTRG